MLSYYGFSCCAIMSGYFVLCVLKRKKDNPKTSYSMGVLNILLTPVSFFKLGPFKYGHRINLVSAENVVVVLVV